MATTTRNDAPTSKTIFPGTISVITNTTTTDMTNNGNANIASADYDLYCQ